ncbi:MAG: hypothetical protein NZL86_07635, partial [Aquificaceae bacterium]|nr:hypothetical protein [Aquificaceae bacterium]
RGAIHREGRRNAPMVDFYIDNWLMASSAVGFARVLEHANDDPKKYFRERVLEVPTEVWQKVPELYADFLLQDFEEVVKSSLENLEGGTLDELKKKKKIKNPYNLVVLSKLANFYTNSYLTNPSASYIREIDDINMSLLKRYGNTPEELKKNLLPRNGRPTKVRLYPS